LLKEGSKVENVTSSIGAEVFGVQLSQLDDKGKDELALFVAQKKVVAFRDQVGRSRGISWNFCLYITRTLHRNRFRRRWTM
jgi:alpha-ketoglutarate-dependent taurine dioxygenase